MVSPWYLHQMNSKIQLHANEEWDLVEDPASRRVVGSKWENLVMMEPFRSLRSEV